MSTTHDGQRTSGDVPEGYIRTKYGTLEPKPPPLLFQVVAAKNFLPRIGLIGLGFFVFAVAWYVIACLVSGIIEAYSSLLGWGEPHTWLDYMQSRTPHMSSSDAWPNWGLYVPVYLLLIVYPLIILFDAFQSGLQLISKKLFPEAVMITVKFHSPSKDFWEREGTFLLCFVVGFVVWFIATFLICCLIEVYSGVLGLPEPNTWIDGQKLGDSWPTWAWRWPVAVVIVGYPVVFFTDVFVCCLRRFTQKSFKARA